MDHDVIQLFDPESSTFTYFLVDRVRARRSPSIRWTARSSATCCS